MPLDVTGLDWVTLGVGLAVLALGWGVVRSLLRLTVKVFTLGCGGLLLLAVIGGVLVYLR